MSTTSRRFVAAAVAAIIAVLTGAVVGLVSPKSSCRLSRAAPSAPASGTAGLAGAGAPAAPVGDVQPAADRPVSCSAAAFGTVPAVVGLAGALVAGIGVFVLAAAGTRRATGRHAPGAVRAPIGPAAVPAPPQSAVAEADRAALIQACIYVRDRTTSKALADRLGAGLREAGVRTVEPDGVRFDPAHHEAGGAAPSGDPAKVGTIAAVEVPGYTDRDGRLLRVPVVTVYRRAAASEREAR
jgi:hypothetical protein